MLERKMRKAYVILVLASLFLPLAHFDGYYFTVLEGIVALMEDLFYSSNWNPLDILDIFEGIAIGGPFWAGPILAISNFFILKNKTEKLVWFNRIMNLIFSLSLIVLSPLIYIMVVDGDKFGLWSYVFLIFLGGIAEAIFYHWEKKGKEENLITITS